MAIGLTLKAGQEIPLTFLLPQGPPVASLFVKLTLERPNGTPILGSPIQMTYLAGEGKFVATGILMPGNEPFVHARFEVFTQSDWDPLSRSQVQSDEDVFALDLSSVSVDCEEILVIEEDEELLLEEVCE